MLGFQESEFAARQIGFAEASRRFKKRGKGAPAPRGGSWRLRTALAAAVLRLSGAAILLETHKSGWFPKKSQLPPLTDGGEATERAMVIV